MIAADLRKRRPRPGTIWDLDEVYLKIAGRMVYLWRAVDAEGKVLDVPVQCKRNKQAALKLMRKLLTSKEIEAMRAGRRAQDRRYGQSEQDGMQARYAAQAGGRVESRLLLEPRVQQRFQHENHQHEHEP